VAAEGRQRSPLQDRHLIFENSESLSRLTAGVAAAPTLWLMPAPQPRLLLVEDDRELVALLTRLLTEEGYDVQHAGDGQRALHLLLTGRYDLAVLDRGLPVVEGLSVLAAARRAGVTTATLVLSARGEPADRVSGLDAGAEDYLGKPFDVAELLARLRALLRRHLDAARSLPLGDRVLDLEARVVRDPRVPGAGVQLSEREAGLLELLASRPGRVYGREELRSRIFPDAESATVVDTYVHYCRRKLGRGVVRTVRGVGYQVGSR